MKSNKGTVTFCGILLAGGLSRRMGRSKAELINRSGDTFLVAQTRKLISTFKQAIIVSSEQEIQCHHRILEDTFGPFKTEQVELEVNGSVSIHTIRRSLNHQLQLVQDISLYKQAGPLVGLYTGMLLSHSHYYFALAIDAPAITERLMQGFMQHVRALPNYDAYIPLDKGNQEQPLAAIYRRNPEMLNKLLREEKRSLKAYYENCKLYTIAYHEWSQWTDIQHPFQNLNTEEEYQAYLKEGS